LFRIVLSRIRFVKFCQTGDFVARIHRYAYKMTIFYLRIGFVEFEYANNCWSIGSTNNLFASTNAKKDAKISL